MQWLEALLYWSKLVSKSFSIQLTVLIFILCIINYLWWSCHVWELQLCLEQEFWPHPSQLRRPWTHWSGPAAPTASIVIPDSSGHLQTCFLYHYSYFSFFFSFLDNSTCFCFSFHLFLLIILLLFCMSRDHLNSFNVVTIIWIHSIKSNKLLFWVSVMSKHFCMDLILIFWLSLSISWFKILQVQHHTSHQKLRQQRRVTYALQGSGLSVRYKLIFVVEFSGLLS